MAPVAEALAPLESELAKWRHAGRRARWWWRDDDLVAPSAQLNLLIAAAERAGATVLAAIIPHAMSPSLPAALEGCPWLLPCQHGYAHRNHEQAGAPASEFGPARALADALADIEAGHARLRAAFGAALIPVFVPPWNRLRDDLAARLPALGINFLSGHGVDHADVAAHVISHNIHLDLLDWGRRDGAYPAPLALTEMAERAAHWLARWRELEAPPPLGLLTHHRVMSDAAWESTHCLLDTLLGADAMALVGADTLFGRAKDGGATDGAD